MSSPSAISEFKEFKEFILKGNAISHAVGVLIGAASGKLVAALAEGLINPMLNLIGGNPNISLKVWVFDVGMVLNSIMALLITGALLFFIFVRPMNRLQKKEAAAPTVEPAPSKEEVLLTKIRDLLAKQP
jgi:large conductance mechanosensitive channel